MIEIFLCIIAEILLIAGIAYYYDETRFPNPSPLVVCFRVGLIGMLVVVSIYAILSVYFLFVRLNANL